MLRLTVAICTWNRARLLEQTLARMLEMRIPHGFDWELVVVNNNCTDDTTSVAMSFADRIPLRVVNEPRAGLSHARNRAMIDSRAEWVLYTDDDVLVDAAWLEAYAEAIAAHADAGVLGGPIEPWLEPPAPEWLVEAWTYARGAYGMRAFGDAITPLTERVTPFGANFALKKSVVAAQPFDPNLGVTPERRLGGEETVLIQKLLREGVLGWWLPAAKLQHFVPRDRQNVNFIRRYYKAVGAFNAEHAPGLPGRSRFAETVSNFLAATSQETKYRVKRALRRPSHTWMYNLVDASERWGFVAARVLGIAKAGA